MRAHTGVCVLEIERDNQIKSNYIRGEKIHFAKWRRKTKIDAKDVFVFVQRRHSSGQQVRCHPAASGLCVVRACLFVCDLLFVRSLMKPASVSLVELRDKNEKVKVKRPNCAAAVQKS